MRSTEVSQCGTLYLWRHPRPRGGDGRCIGRTDLAVDRRKAKRLARRIQRHARRHGLAHAVVTSTLRRCADVGRWLARWGWRHRSDAALVEIDFGDWDGRPWGELPRAEFDAWCADLMHVAPGGGESVAGLLQRVRGWTPRDERIVVGHAGWINAMRWIARHGDAAPSAADWPAAPRFATLTLQPPGAQPPAQRFSSTSSPPW